MACKYDKTVPGTSAQALLIFKTELNFSHLCAKNKYNE